MVNQCPTCGGELRYEIGSGKLKCIHCDAAFDPEAFQSATDAKERPNYMDMEMDVTLYTCPRCGAQISAAENAAVDYCLYCGSFVTLEKEMSRIRKPDYIVPFSQTPELCKASYRKMIRSKLYAPKEFRKDEFIDGFKGIYVPFWTYEYTYGPDIHIPGETTSRHGDYIYHQKYDISCTVEDGLKEVAFDASSAFDDRMSRNIVPFDPESRKTFNPSYMFGFFGDTADVPDQTYSEDAADIARDTIWDELISKSDVKDGHPTRPDNISFDKKIKLKKEHTLTMLPVWFLTWKKNDRVAYSVINGDNGKIYSEIPVSIFRYLLISIITAIPLFFLLNWQFTFSASNMLLISAVLSGLMILLYGFELDSIVRRLNHADDKGYLAVYQKDKDPDENLHENLFFSALRSIFSDGMKETLLTIGGIILIGAVVLDMTVIVVILGFLVLPFYSLWCIWNQSKVISDLFALLDPLPAYAAYFISLVILYIDPPANMIYYIAAILCLIAIGFTAVRTMQRYNDLITRPMPHFFERKAGDGK